MSTIKANDIQNASGGIPTVKGQRLIPTAWVNFNGQNTVTINGGENVSSITDNSTGDYRVNFTAWLPDDNYSITTSSSSSTTNNTNVAYYSKVAGSVSIRSYRAHDGGIADSSDCSVTILGGQA